MPGILPRCATTGRRALNDAETDLRFKRSYDTVENKVASPADPALMQRITGPKAIRDQSKGFAVPSRIGGGDEIRTHDTP